VALIVLDASVIIAHVDDSDALHDAAVAVLRHRKDDDLRLPASAYAEALVGPATKGDLERGMERINMLPLRIEPIGAMVAERAAALRAARPALRLPDALVLGCAQALGAEEVVTADRRWRGHDRVTVIG